MIVTAPPTLAVGTYTGEIVFTSQLDNQAMTVPVTLTVADPSTAFLGNLPGQLSFTLKAGGSTPPSLPFQIRNAGTGGLKLEPYTEHLRRGQLAEHIRPEWIGAIDGRRLHRESESSGARAGCRDLQR